MRFSSQFPATDFKPPAYSLNQLPKTSNLQPDRYYPKPDTRNQLRGQVSLELLITMGVVLAFTMPVILLMLSVSQFGYESSTIAQAHAASKVVADNINELFVQGAGAKRTISVAFPINMQSLNISGNEVVITLKTSTGAYQAASPIFANASIPNPATLSGKTGLMTIAMQTISKPGIDGSESIEVVLNG